MKYGIIISIVIVLVFAGALLYINAGDAPDKPTEATSAERLALAELPGDLPTLVEPANPDSDAGDAYRDVLTHFRKYESAFTRRDPSRWPKAQVAQLRELMVEASQAGDVPEGFLDRYLPLELKASPRFGPALEWIETIVLHEADRLFEAGEHAEAERAALSVWALGRRAFEHNGRLFNRRQGLALMGAAGQTLIGHAEDIDIERSALSEWADAINQLQDKWQPKLQAILSHDPHAGDLVNVAKHDADRSFRIEATLRLGIAKFTGDGEANRQAVRRAIDQLKQDEDPMVSKAAQQADAATRADVNLSG